MLVRRKLLAVALPALLAFVGLAEPAVAAAPKKAHRTPAAVRCAKGQTAVKTKSGKTMCKATAKGTTKRASRSKAAHTPPAKKPMNKK